MENMLYGQIVPQSLFEVTISIIVDVLVSSIALSIANARTQRPQKPIEEV